MALCKEHGFENHPARFPEALPRFFIQFLTTPDDLVVDIFSGSNTTGCVAECLNRRWVAIEVNCDYAVASSLRFMDKWEPERIRKAVATMNKGGSLDLNKNAPNHRLVLEAERNGHASAETSHPTLFGD